MGRAIALFLSSSVSLPLSLCGYTDNVIPSGAPSIQTITTYMHTGAHFQVNFMCFGKWLPIPMDYSIKNSSTTREILPGE